MNFQFDIASSAKPAATPAPFPVGDNVLDILRQILEVQREQLQQILDVQREQLQHARMSAQENLARWRNLLSRWNDEQPEFADHCKTAYPVLEKAYVQMLTRMTQELADQDEDALDNEFALQEFIDRFGMKVGQMSHLLSIIGPLSEAAHQLDHLRKQEEQQKQQEKTQASSEVP